MDTQLKLLIRVSLVPTVLPTIQADFSEQQLELITPIAHSTKRLSAMWQAAQLTRVNACGLCPCHHS